MTRKVLILLYYTGIYNNRCDAGRERVGQKEEEIAMNKYQARP